MIIIESIIFFVFGTIFGSFYNVVGSRLPAGESIVSPGSHCTKCKHQLTAIELIPIISYIIQGGKCKNCHTKLSICYPLYEFLSGLIFMFCYIKFGISTDIIVPISFLSMLLIIVISDFEYMIIPDEVLFVFGVILVLEIFILNGPTFLLECIIDALIAFGSMLLIKILGDFLFGQESMGGGDIKLLFFFGLCLGWQNSLLSILLGSVVGFPISLLVMKLKKTNIIPFGPFLAIGATIIVLTSFDIDLLMNILVN